MKVAIKTVPVYSNDGSKKIGELNAGNETLVIGEVDGGVVIAYILGLVKEDSAIYLKNTDEWEETVGEIERFLAYVLSREGCLYVWGAQGQEMTPALIKRLENSQKNYGRAVAHYKKHIKNGETLVAYDCSGLIVAYLLENEYIASDTTANGLYFYQCDAIEKNDLVAGDLVFKKYLTKNKMHHVGVYMGDGTVVHAKGRDDGVVRESLSSNSWNRFGRLGVFANSGVDAVYTRKLKYTGRPCMRGDDVRAVQTALYDTGFNPGGIDGLYGPKTQKAVIAFQTAKRLAVDGIVGPITWPALFV